MLNKAVCWSFGAGAQLFACSSGIFYLYMLYFNQNGIISCWKIVYDNDGKPYTLKLVDKDIFAD